MNISNNNGGVNGLMQGSYKALIVDSKTGEVVKDYGWNKNLILNWGMDLVAYNSYARLTSYCVAGTGSRMNSIAGGLSVITQSGNMVTLWPTSDGLQNFSSSVTSSTNILYYSHSLQIGDVIVYNNLSKSNVTAVDNSGGLTASVDTSYTIDATNSQSFMIWKTSQTGLQNEKKRTADYLVGVGNCGTTYSTGSNGKLNVATYRRTYDFTPEVNNSLYTELGTSPTSNTNLNVFSRVLLPVPIAVSSSFLLRVVYDLQVTYTPEVPQYFTASISGWPNNGSTNTYATQSIQCFLAPSVATGGDAPYPGNVLDPCAFDIQFFPEYNYIYVFTSGNSASLAPFGSAINRNNNGGVSIGGNSLSSSYGRGRLIPYVSGSYNRYKINDTFQTNESNRTDIRSFGLGFTNNAYDTNNQAICVLMNQSQSKFNTQTLSFTWKFAWDRILGGT